MKSHITSTTRSRLLVLSSRRMIINQRLQNFVLASPFIIPQSLPRPCRSRSFYIQSKPQPPPLPIRLLSKCYFSSKATLEATAIPSNEAANDNTAAPYTATKHSEASSTTTENSTESTSLSSIPLVYESPLGNVVSKLRTVSLGTALIGMTGVPAMIAIKGSTIPEAGILAAALLFVSGSMGSTAAIHFVFSPYVYKIEQIPIRVCSTPVVAGVSIETSSDGTARDSSNETQNAPIVKPMKDMLLKAWTRTLFLRNDALVFDPTIDVQPYKGLRPMCNFIAKGKPLYVHPEYVYDANLRRAMNLDKDSPATVVATKANPDDDLF